MGACKAPEAALQGPTPTAAATSQSSEDPNCRLGYEQRIVRESSVPEASEAKVKLEPSLREGLDDKEQQQAPPPALQMEGLGSSYRDAAAASGKNYRDFAAATRNHRGGSLADYWRQRRWAPEQLQPAAACSREVAETPGQRVQPSRHAETSAAKAEASPDQSRSLSREDGPSDHDGCLLLRDRQDFGDLFILDITEHNSPLGLFLLHTLTETGGRVVVHCHDYCYPLHIAAPVVLPGPSLSEDLQDHGDTLCLSPPSGWIASAIGDALARLLGLPAPGTRLAKTSRTARSSSNRSGTDPGADLNAQELSVEIVERIPLVYYRPTGQKSGSHSFLRVRFPSSLIPVKRAAEALRQLLATGCLAHVPPGTPGMGLGVGVRTARLHWEDNTVYEDDLKIKSHFLHDCRLSAGSWVSLSDASQVSN